MPRLWNRLFERVHHGVSHTPLRRSLLAWAVAAKAANWRRDGRLTHALWDRLLFRPLAAKMGLERAKILVSGAAPILPEVKLFFRVALSAPFFEVYGQTESGGLAFLSSPFERDDDAVDFVTPNLEAKLEDVPAMGYLSSDVEHLGRPCHGRGELCLRGPSISPGYFKEVRKTAEAIDKEGWLHTGDVGLWTERYAMRIIDRKSNIFKLAQGEFVAAEKVELMLQASPLIAQAFVYGDPLRSCLVAIVVPEPAPFLKACRAAGIFESSPPSRAAEGAAEGSAHQSDQQRLRALCSLQAAERLVFRECDAVSAELAGFERVKALALEATPFSIENGLLTVRPCRPPLP